MSKRILYKKIGGGTFRMSNGKIIKPNQEFAAKPEEIPVAFRDVVIPLEDLPPEPEEIPIIPVEGFMVVERESKHWYDVINKITGKAMNERALRKKAAEELFKELS